MSNDCAKSNNTFTVNEMISLVNTEQYDKLENVWQGIAESDGKNLQSLFEVVDLLAKRDEKRRAHNLLMMLVPYYKRKEIYQDVLSILKRVLEYNPKEKTVAKEIGECYSHIYKDVPYAKSLVEKTGIETAADVPNALKTLEKYFYLTGGDYVHHKSWGVGRVASIDADGEKIVVDFEKKSNHSIAMDLAPSILQKLDKDDLLAMIYAQKDVLDRMAAEDPVGLVKLALRYFKGRASVSNIKARLTSGVMPVEAWSKWWTGAKKLLKKDPYIKLTEGTPTTSFLEFRAAPMSHHQEILEKLRAAPDAGKRIELAKKYVSEIKESDLCKETIGTIAGVFLNESDALQESNPSQAIECLLLLEDAQALVQGESANYSDRIDALVLANASIPELIEKIGVLEYRKRVLERLTKICPEKWQDYYVATFFVNGGNLWEFIVKELLAENKQPAIDEIAFKVYNHFNAYPEHYIWFCKNGMQGRYPELYRNVDPAVMFNRLIELLDNICFKIQKGRDGELKSIANKVLYLLEDKGTDYAINILNDANAESIFNIVSSSKGLEDWFKVAIESVIQDRFPDIFEKPGPPKLDENKIHVTKAGYEKRKAEFDHLMNVEFPENARDLGEAISRGDLRENAEYKAAREKQAMLVEKAERMKSELQKAVIIDPRVIQTGTVSPGARVVLKQQGKQELETYTLLGPWDVDIEKGIISYLSPVGKGLLNKSAGDVITIKLPEGESIYEIIKIEVAVGGAQ